MKNFDRKKHWEEIYRTKELSEVSWYQPNPETSLDFIRQFDIPKTAKIIDVGGGDSLLVDHLLRMGYLDITVLDISSAAIERAKLRLGKLAAMVKWIVADAAHFKTEEKYDLWHDRAAFHFLTEESDVAGYLQTAKESLRPGAMMVIGTFSEDGPLKCSGIEIRRYSETTMTERLKAFFVKIRCVRVEHKTPFNTIQNFIFCSFRKPMAA
ncbi:MAG: class I SAM-dependent methyltransferase [Bacteroidia bacterium]|nr:class I SAM-dependent methyltransferase [Bacteroidia bacterium]